DEQRHIFGNEKKKKSSGYGGKGGGILDDRTIAPHYNVSLQRTQRDDKEEQERDQVGQKPAPLGPAEQFQGHHPETEIHCEQDATEHQRQITHRHAKTGDEESFPPMIVEAYPGFLQPQTEQKRDRGIEQRPDHQLV